MPGLCECELARALRTWDSMVDEAMQLVFASDSDASFDAFSEDE